MSETFNVNLNNFWFLFYFRKYNNKYLDILKNNLRDGAYKLFGSLEEFYFRYAAWIVKVYDIPYTLNTPPQSPDNINPIEKFMAEIGRKIK